MGQRLSEEVGVEHDTEVDSESAYSNKDVSELQRLVQCRGIALPKTSKDACEDSTVLTTLLLAYDAGMSAAAASSVSSGYSDKVAALKEAPSRRSTPVLNVLQRIRDSPGHMGVDIGGTLVKMAIALPYAVSSEYDFPSNFGLSGRTHHHLEFEIKASGMSFVVRFISGSTSQMEKAVQQLGLRRNRSWGGFPTSPKMQPGAKKGPPWVTESISETGDTGGSDIERSFMDVATLAEHTASFTDFSALENEPVGEGTDWARQLSSDWSDAGCASYRPIRRVAAAGGGACKFAPLFRDALRVEIQQVKELSAVVDGLLLMANHHEAHGDPAQLGCQLKLEADLYTIGEDGKPMELPWPQPLFPLILVNMGSGVSILRVDSAKDNDYVRVGGTACGGSTFLGLARALTSACSFEEALALAERGDASQADKLVRDIYGDEGSASLGLAGNLTAANFGKLSELPADGPMCSEEDLARSLLQMVTQQSVLLATAFAKHAKCLDRVFFVGGFVDEPNHIARTAIAANFRSLGGCAYFLRHSDFLGALGSLRSAFQDIEEHVHGP